MDCPICFLNPQNLEDMLCTREDCEWWDKYNEQCAIVTFLIGRKNTK